ncbi:MAG: hypothetical protein KBS62_03030 [Oscillospiraceae bacterium]|nr:hypothetical protein [Candidatus Ruminococcus equi]
MNEQQAFMPQNNLAVIKNTFKTKKLVSIAIIDILTILFSGLTIVLSANFLKSTLEFASKIALEQTGRDISPYIKPFSAISMGISAISMLPYIVVTVLLIIANLIIFCKCNNKDEYASPKAGFVIQFIVAIINLISGCFVSFYMLVVTFITPILVGFTKTSEKENVTLITVISIIIAGASVFLILYTTINKLLYINSIRKALNGEKLSSKGAKPTAVMYVLSAIGLGVFALFMTFLIVMITITGSMYKSLYEFDISPVIPLLGVGIIVTIITFIKLILQAKIAFDYKDDVEDALYEYIKDYADGYSNFSESYLPVTDTEEELITEESENTEIPSEELNVEPVDIDIDIDTNEENNN